VKKLATWIAFHCAHWAALYGAFIIELDGALYILKFFVWAMVFIAPLMLTDAATEQGLKDSDKPVRGAMTRIQSWTTLLALVWFGHIATAIAWLWVMACAAIYRESVKKARADIDSAAGSM
jgi:hypothetical protein